MKKIYSLFSILSIGLGFSQTILNQSETASRTVQDPQTVIMLPGFHANSATASPFVAKIGDNGEGGGTTDSGAGATNPSGTFGNNSFHDTQGNIEVNGGGQLQFTLPIALPPGVKSVAPQINLVYTGGSGNGIAGYGWSLSGITSISRMGKTIEKDGEVKGVQFDYSDYYSFNGQRLLYKSGGNGPSNIGANGSIYTTEKYSNIKVKAIGSITGQVWQGPEYWEVTFEDGSQSWYGAVATGSSNARTPVEYNIVKWKDAQGNYITYNYVQSDNVAVISSIQWGGNETQGKTHFNEMVFNYTNRNLQEASYSKGISFIQKSLLQNIVVVSNGSQFKKYIISYEMPNVDGDDSKIIHYQFVKEIKEFNANNEEASPITFSTKELTTSFQEKPFINFESVYLTGDYDGDGLVDFILKESAQNGKPEGYYLYFDKLNNTTPSFLYLGASGTLPNLTNFTVKPTDNIIKPRQGLVTVKNIYDSSNPQSNGEIEIKCFSISMDPSLLNTFNNPLVLEHSKSIAASDYQAPSYTNFPPANYGYYIKSEASNPKEIDIDRDGISELVFTIFDKGYYKRQYPAPYEWVSVDLGYRYMIIDHDDFISNTFTKINTPTTTNLLESAYVMDFDNDGTQDILKIEFPNFNNYAKTDVTFYTKNKYTNADLQRTVNTSINIISQYYIKKIGSSGNNKYVLQLKQRHSVKGIRNEIKFGDLNGDGNIEILTPLEKNKSGDSHIAGWSFYLNNGQILSEFFQGFIEYYDQPFVTNGYYEKSQNSVIDIDNDGKSDFLHFYVGYNTQASGNYSNSFLSKTSEFKYDLQNTKFKWSWQFSTLFSNHKSGESLTPIFGDFRINNNVFKVIFLSQSLTNAENKKLFSYQSYNLAQDKNIHFITQGNLVTQIDYKELNPAVNPNFYEPVKQEQYPYVELDKISQSYAISQVRQDIVANGENKVRKQDFRYRGLITHLQGKGMIGFRQTARSSWYTDDFVNTKVWSGAEIDPLNDGVPIKEWSIKTNNENQIFPTDLSVNNTQLLSFKQTTYQTDIITGVAYNTIKAILPIQSITKDFLNDINTESTITYGDYYLPHQTVVKTNNDYAINTTTLEYVHNINGTGKDYYVGRPQSKTETVFYSPTSDTKSAKQEYTYNANNLLETLKTYNRDDSGWFLETYTYDDFGNITQKEITNSVDDNTKTDKAEYDAKGRFVLKKIDNLGLETNITYNDWGQVLTQTDTFGNTLTNEYDNWGKLLKSKTNLSGYTTYTYEKFSNGDAVVNEYAPDGGRVITYTNKFGQKYKSVAKAFGQSRFVASEIQFDGLGRKIKESEPYFEDFDGATPSQWNTIGYDDYSRPIKATSFTGKIMQSTYGVRSVKAVETNANNRFKEQKTDPVGKVISTEDLGGVITFKYNAAGENIEADYEGNKVKTSYDAWGNKTRFEDPSNGVYEYKYLGYFGALSESKSPKGKKEYEYNDKGQLVKLKEKSDTGNSTDKVIAFNYNSKGQIISKSGTSLGKPYSSIIAYASNGRLLSSMESSNGKYFIQKDIVYDDKSRVTSYEKSLYSSGVLTKVSIENVYDSWSGELYQVKDKNANKVLWELQDANAKGQVTQAKLGGVNVNNSYDNNGFLNSISHISATNQATVLQISYSFNAIKNELNSRTTGGDFNIIEQFQYDDNNRLYNWTDPLTGAFTQNQKRNEYDKRGRIIKNDQLGTVKFENTQKIYQATGMTLNAEGEQNYNNDLIQSIAYNENNDPVYIDGARGDARFEYGLTNMRQVASYGGNFDPDSDGKFTKYYSEDGSYEVIKNNQTGQEKHLLYIGGTPYESNIVYLKNFQEAQAKFVFLHKDYLGSILAITDEAGNKLEQRHFDAWGNLTHLKVGTNAIITNKEQIRDYLANGNLIIDRGYTSHEHFAEIGIIHMNGRLYDPLLRRFLNADENIQDPNNTQNYNKYGYVMNNPLMYNDPSGEWFGIDDLIVAAVSFVIGYVSHGIMTGQWGWNAVKAGFQFAIMGWISYNTAGLASGKVSTAMWNFVENSAINAAITCVIPPMNLTIWDFDFSISPSIAIGKGWGFGANVSATFHAGDFAISGGFGIMHYGGHAGSGQAGWEYRKSIMAGTMGTQGNLGIMLGTNVWSGLHPQQTGIIRLASGDFSLTYENDGSPFGGLGLGDNNDRWRTAAMTISIGNFHAGFNLFTGERNKDSYYNIGDSYQLGNEEIPYDYWQMSKYGKGDYLEGAYGERYTHGLVKETGPQYRLGAAYIGWGNYRIGINSEWVRHGIQNVLAHRWISPQPAFLMLSNTWKNPYFQYQTRNQFTSW